MWVCAQDLFNFLVEHDVHSRKVLQRDFPDVPLFNDVEACAEVLPPVDVLAAGFPCQPFSAANRKRLACRDPRCTPILTMLDYVDRTRPKLILLENVLGLLTFGKDTFHLIGRRLQAAGYAHRSIAILSDSLSHRFS